MRDDPVNGRRSIITSYGLSCVNLVEETSRTNLIFFLVMSSLKSVHSRHPLHRVPTFSFPRAQEGGFFFMCQDRRQARQVSQGVVIRRQILFLAMSMTRRRSRRIYQ